MEKTPVTKSETQPLPGETPGTGTDVANIKIPGIDFPYPEYLRNIMNEVLRRWNAPNNRLRAEVAFLILKDGSVRDIRFLKRSGNFSFDLEAQGAIEAAGQRQGVRSAARRLGCQRASRDLRVRAASVMRRALDVAVGRSPPSAGCPLGGAGLGAAAGRRPAHAALRPRQPAVARDRARAPGSIRCAPSSSATSISAIGSTTIIQPEAEAVAAGPAAPAQLRAVQEFRRGVRARAGADAPARPRCACTT